MNDFSYCLWKIIRIWFILKVESGSDFFLEGRFRVNFTWIRNPVCNTVVKEYDIKPFFSILYIDLNFDVFLCNISIVGYGTKWPKNPPPPPDKNKDDLFYKGFVILDNSFRACSI